jgi:hypothetical protein
MSANLGQSEVHQSVLYSLHHFGPANYLELELRLRKPGLYKVVIYLQQSQLIQGQAKKRDRLRVYEITDAGKKAIGVLNNVPQPRSTQRRPDYVPPAQSYMRPGAMDAFMIPSGDRSQRMAA